MRVLSFSQKFYDGGKTKEKMKTKVKKFSHKLLALFMAIVMGLTCFSGAFAAFGADTPSNQVGYYDGDVEYNTLGWSVLSDEQTATALLDYSDEMLEEYGPMIDNLLAGFLPTSGMYYYDANNRAIGLNVGGIIKATIKVRTHSVDELLETLESVSDTINDFKSFIGDAGNLHFDSAYGMRRSNSTSCDIIRAVLGILQKNSADYNGNDVLGEFLRGGFDLGTVGGFINLDIYGEIGKLVGAPAGYESDFIYNMIQSVLFNYSGFFTDEEIAAYRANPSSFVYDTVLLEKMTDKLLTRISAPITYDEGYTDQATGKYIEDTSATRYVAIKEYMKAHGVDYAAAASALGYDPNLVYSDEFADKDGNYLNVLLFAYGSPDANGLPTSATKHIELTENDSLYAFGYKALDFAWDTAIKDTLNLLHVNYDVNRGDTGTNFDNEYYYYTSRATGWSTADVASNYTQAKINAWANACYADYKAATPAEFLDNVKANLTHDREVAAGATGKWSDIDATTLFNKLRYSPLADYAFNMQTGPINLYFLQTGAPNVEAFFANDYSKYATIVSGLNDCLVALVKDFFPQTANVYGTLPELAKTLTGDSDPYKTIDSTATAAISSTLVSNAIKVVQYTADATDKNILNGFYLKYGSSAQLSESTLESAMIPMLIACIGQVNLNGKLQDIIHPSDWDACQDAEAVAFIALREYLSYILPQNDYNSLVNITENSITAKSGKMLDDVIVLMARDAVVYVMNGAVPVTDANGHRWTPDSQGAKVSMTQGVDDFFTLLNSVVCYYLGDYTMERAPGKAMGLAALFGVCDKSNGNSLITMDNTLWENLDLVANKLIPLLGELQGRGRANASTYKFIWTDVVNSVIDVNATNFINTILTFISGASFQTTPVVTTVYTALADFMNALFGARYNGQGWTTVIPAAASTHPFDDLFHKNNIVGKDGKNVGALQKIICNFVEFAGYGTKGPRTYPDSMLRGICFALQAVNSFIPEALNNIGAHTLKMASSKFEQATVQNAAAGTKYTTNVIVKNESLGINNAYLDGMTDEVKQMSRYYVSITGTSINGSGMDSDVAIGSAPSGLLAPGEKVSIPVTTKFIADANLSTSYYVTVTYNITDSTGKVLYPNLETVCYQYLTGAQSWESVVYSATSGDMRAFPSNLKTNTANKPMGSGDTIVKTTANFGAFIAGYPINAVVGTSNLSATNTMGLRILNTNDSQKSLDGYYTFDANKSVKTNDLTTAIGADSANKVTSNVTVNYNNAKPMFDEKTGDLLNVNMYDYREETSAGSGVFGDWQRNYVTETVGDVSGVGYYKGYTGDEVGTMVKAAAEKGLKTETRTHVVYKLQEALDAKIIAAYYYNDVTGVYDHVYLKNGGTYGYNVILSLITMQGIIDGYYINGGKRTFAKNEEQYVPLSIYDGSTSIKPGEYPVNICFYTGGGQGTAAINLVVGDNRNAFALNTTYNALSELITSYRKSDFTDASVYDYAKDALLNALAAQAQPLNPTSAAKLSDTTELRPVTKQTTSAYGDQAFVPFMQNDDGSAPEALPAKIALEAYVGDGESAGALGVYYLDEACTMPIYTNTPLTDNDVYEWDGVFYDNYTDTEVVKATDELGNTIYCFNNTPVMETEWLIGQYTVPWRQPTDVQATDSNDKLLYNQDQYVYRNSAGEKVNSGEDWVCKFAETENGLVSNIDEYGNPTTTDNRGLYTRANDYAAYATEQIYENVNKSIAQPLFDDMTNVRHGLNSANFDTVSYNRMVNSAQKAERYYTVDVTYPNPNAGQVGQDATITKTGLSISDFYKLGVDPTDPEVQFSTKSTLSSVQVAEYLRLYNIYTSVVVERGYIGDQLEAEIECASGNSYANLNATEATYNEDGTVATSAVITKGTNAAAPAHGSWDASGKLVNIEDGEQAYTNESWEAYTAALANAVTIAQLGNGSYAYKNEAYYVPGAEYTARVTNCYTADTNLQRAEIALSSAETVLITVQDVAGATVTVNGVEYTGPVACQVGETVKIAVTANAGYVFDYMLVNGEKVETSTYSVKLASGDADINVQPVVKSAGKSVSASLVVATSPTGATNNVPVNGDYTVTVMSGDTQVASQTFTMSKANNTFELTLAPGTYTATIESEYSLTRDNITIIVGDNAVSGAVIPVIACDFDKNGYITAADTGVVYKNSFGSDGDKRCDLDGNGFVTAADTGIVYACSFGTPNLPAITIQ